MVVVYSLLIPPGLGVLESCHSPALQVAALSPALQPCSMQGDCTAGQGEAAGESPDLPAEADHDTPAGRQGEKIDNTAGRQGEKIEDWGEEASQAGTEEEEKCK